MIRVKIISYEDWQRIQSDENITIDNFKDRQDEQTLPGGPPLIPEYEENITASAEQQAYSLAYSQYFNMDNTDKGPQDKFMIMDINDDNLVTRREYLISTGTPITESDFAQYDRNRDGFLTRFEVD